MGYGKMKDSELNIGIHFLNVICSNFAINIILICHHCLKYLNNVTYSKDLLGIFIK